MENNLTVKRQTPGKRTREERNARKNITNTLWRLRNPEKQRAIARRYQIKKKDKIKAYMEIYSKEYYKNPVNAEKRRVSRRNKRNSIRLWCNDIKTKIGCKICQETHPACLHFHHKDRAKKLYTIALGRSNKTKEALLLEIEKCDVLCANCHAKIHEEEISQIRGKMKTNKIGW